MTPTDWIALSAIAATVLVAAVTQYFSWKFRQREDKQFSDRLRRDDEVRKQEQAREDELRLTHREDEPHIEFGINCQVHGQMGEDYLVEFILTAYNRGLVRWQIETLVLRVRGIEKDDPLVFWPGREPRLQFPVKLIDGACVIPPKYSFFFVEPGVRQIVTYVTKIPSRVDCIVAHLTFSYDPATPHTAERVFRLSSPSGPS